MFQRKKEEQSKKEYLKDEETFLKWKAELAETGKKPEELIAMYEEAGLTEYAKKVRSVIQRMEESA